MESSLYYFYSTGCAWCKKADVIVDKLNNDGYNILKLDIDDGDNGKLYREVRDELNLDNKRCGTPLFVNVDNDSYICGFAPEQVLKLWAEGEEIPENFNRPKTAAPQPPKFGSSKKEEDAWKVLYEAWLKENDHLMIRPTADDVLSKRPKTQFPPVPFNATDEQIDEWESKYDQWIKDNPHIQNIPSKEQVRTSILAKRNKTNQQPKGTQAGGNVIATLTQDVRTLKVEVDSLKYDLKMVLDKLDTFKQNEIKS